MTKTKSREDSIFLSLEGMRGVGAVLVVVGHTLLFWPGLEVQMRLMPYLVDMFFLFSGFVIAYALEPKKNAHGVTAKAFIVHRLVRLYPLFLLSILMGFGVYVLSMLDERVDAGKLAVEVVPQFFMIPSLSADKHLLYTLNTPAWSLFFELCANLFYILMFRFLTTRVLIVVVAMFAVFLAVVTSVYGDMDLGWSTHHFIGGFARAGFGFFLGVLVYRLNGSPTAPPRKVGIRAWVLMSVYVLVMSFVPFGSWTMIVQLGSAFVFGPIVMSLAVNETAPKFMSKFCIWIGGISYALYLVHVPIAATAERIGWRYPELQEQLGIFAGMGVLVVSVLLAWFVDVHYDRPIRKWIYRKLSARTAKGAPVAATAPAPARVWAAKA